MKPGSDSTTLYNILLIKCAGYFFLLKCMHSIQLLVYICSCWQLYFSANCGSQQTSKMRTTLIGIHSTKPGQTLHLWQSAYWTIWWGSIQHTSLQRTAIGRMPRVPVFQKPISHWEASSKFYHYADCQVRIWSICWLPCPHVINMLATELACYK